MFEKSLQQDRERQREEERLLPAASIPTRNKPW